MTYVQTQQCSRPGIRRKYSVGFSLHNYGFGNTVYYVIFTKIFKIFFFFQKCLQNEFSYSTVDLIIYNSVLYKINESTIIDIVSVFCIYYLNHIMFAHMTYRYQKRLLDCFAPSESLNQKHNWTCYAKLYRGWLSQGKNKLFCSHIL